VREIPFDNNSMTNDSGPSVNAPSDLTVNAVEWPQKHDVLGVNVSATTYAEVAETVIAAARAAIPAIVDFSPVDIIVQASRSAAFRARINSFHLICPDGQPVRWFLNYFHKARLRDRVCGTTAMLRVCEVAAQTGVSVYLYGSTPCTLACLKQTLLTRFPNLLVAGVESPPFRPLTEDEDDCVVRRINASGAGVVFIGIGSPKQEHFAWEHRNRINAVQLCVGAAFDFIAGTKKRAPEWMQRVGLEWLFRLCQEPRRLWNRYLSTNSRFLLATLGHALNRRPDIAR
jgi:exopolysaccharide biosynthesis WecB/TagA/CpsF family protein